MMDDWKYYGEGMWKSNDGYVQTHCTEISQCLKFCKQQIRRHGMEWNGMVWRRWDGWCGCFRNDKGHRTSADFLGDMHFKTDYVPVDRLSNSATN